MDEEDDHFLSASHRKCILLSGTECHIINYLLTELAWAVPGNISPRSFLYGPRCVRSVLSRSRANIPQYGPRARLVRGYYWARLSKISWFVSGEQINYLPKPKPCFIIRSPFFWSTKYVKSLSACSGNRSAIFTQDVDSITHEWAE